MRPRTAIPFRSLPVPAWGVRETRAVLLVLGLFVAACLPGWSTLWDRREAYFFDVALTSSVGGVTRLAWDNGRGFNDHDSSAQPLHVETQPVTYRYLLPYGRITRLRFSPVDRPGVVTLTQPRIVDSAGQVLRRIAPTDLTADAGCTVTTAGETARVVVTIPGPPTSLAIRLDGPVELPFTWRAVVRNVPLFAWIILVAGLLLAWPAATRVVPAWTLIANRAARRPRRTLAAAALVAVAWQAHPVLFQGRSFVSPANGSLMLYADLPTVPGAHQAQYADGMGSDVGAMLFQHLYYPMLERAALVRDHELPLWNRSSLCGVPLLGQGQSMLGDPFNLLTILGNGAGWAWDVRFVLAHWLLAFGLGLAAWQLTRHLPAALLTVLGASFIGFFTYRLNHPVTFSVAYAPWLLVGWLALAQARSRRGEQAALALLLLAHWIEYSSGTVKEAVVLIVMLDAIGAGLVVGATAGRVRWRRIACAALAVLVFCLLAAPLWWSFLGAWRHSFTASDTPQAGVLPWREAIGLFDDLFYRQNSREEWVVSPSLNFLFLGGVLAFALGRQRRADGSPEAPADERAAARVLVVGALVVAGAAFGAVPDRWILAIPLLRNLGHTGDVFSCVLLVIVPLIAALGFRRALRGPGRSPSRLRAAGVVFAGCGLLYAWYANPGRAGISPFCTAYAIQLGAALAVLALAVRWTRTAHGDPACRIACLLAIPLLLWRHGQYGQSVFNHYVFVPGERLDVHAASPAVAAIDARRESPARVLGLGMNLFPGYAAALGWESLYGVDALRNPWYEELAATLDLRRVSTWAEPDEERDVARLGRARDLLNVRYYLADPSASPRSLGTLQRRVHADLDVYASPTAWPRAFFTDRLARYETATDFARMLAGGDGRPFAAAQRGEDNVPALDRNLRDRAIRPATDYRLTANATRFAVDAPSAGVVVLSETYYPGDFRVTVDGRPEDYFRVNHAFKGIAVTSPGPHVVVVRYWPRHFEIALGLAAVGLVALLASGIWILQPDRKGRTSRLDAMGMS